MKAEDVAGKSRSPVRTYEVKRYEPTTCIEKYSYMLIRPPRFLYNEEILNPRRKYKNRFEHQVFEIPFPLSLFSTPVMRYVILYLHGNSSSRYEGYSQLGHLPPDIGLACFDFNGCGNRTEKQFISLGKSEAEEVDIAVRFLKSKGFAVVLWGRSMGSISALLS
jgi:pimeloyl-ACP methyl ester carboxylesterase